MSDTPTSYPLAWPRNKARTPHIKRREARFHSTDTDYSTGSKRLIKRDVTVAGAVRRLQVELERLDALSPIISTNIEVKLDGTPYSNRRAPEDPGVAIYFRLKNDPVSLACDTYYKVADNIVAMAKHLEASRAIERYGVATLREIFRGYMALPEYATVVIDWASVLGHPPTLEKAETVYKALMMKHHPDKGGTQEDAVRFNEAIRLARQHFS